MDYHARNICQDDIIQMPADGSTFRDMEEKWPHFKEEPTILGFLWKQMVLIHLQK